MLSDAINDDTTNLWYQCGNTYIIWKSPVSAANTGYLKIGKEIISYTGLALQQIKLQLEQGDLLIVWSQIISKMI